MGNAIQKNDDVFSPVMRWWRLYHGYAILRLRVDVSGAAGLVKPRGDLVLARWREGRPFITGWLVQNIGFTCVLKESEVEVIERP